MVEQLETASADTPSDYEGTEESTTGVAVLP